MGTQDSLGQEHIIEHQISRVRSLSYICHGNTGVGNGISRIYFDTANHTESFFRLLGLQIYHLQKKSKKGQKNLEMERDRERQKDEGHWLAP